jgi:hypothetical protein
LEKLASDFLSTFTIIDYLPETPGVVDQKSGSKETKVPNVERLSEKIFIETDQLRSKSSPSTAISTDNVGMAIDENSAKSMEPKDIIASFCKDMPMKNIERDSWNTPGGMKIKSCSIIIPRFPPQRLHRSPCPPRFRRIVDIGSEW